MTNKKWFYKSTFNFFYGGQEDIILRKEGVVGGTLVPLPTNT
jgi:hypothetical protein